MKYTHRIHRRLSSQSSARDGFTLIELLSVIAVVGVLVGILIPAIGKVRAKAHESTCVSNLRQLAVAATMYASEHRGNFISLYSDAPDGEVWIDQIAPYIDGERRNRVIEVINCPSAEYVLEFDGRRASTYSYGWNPNLVPDTRDLDGDGVSASPHRQVNLQRPSQTLLVADTIQLPRRGGWGNDHFIGSKKAYDPTTADRPLPEASYDSGFSTRHDGHGNAAFVDGHVESFAIGDILEKHVLIER